MNRINRLLEQRWEFPLGALAVLLAWGSRFVQDDAFISFRYAQNLAQGYGLVWNPGELPVEGYTNFLWTVALVPAFWLGVDPGGYAHALSLAAFSVTLCLTYRLALSLWQERGSALSALALLGFNYSFIISAAGGLETQFGIAWGLGAVWLMHRGRLFWAALASACAVMTRMDALLLLFPFWCYQGYQGYASRKVGRVLGAGGALALIVCAWLVWRHGYYGEWVPNTFFIKRGGIGPTPLRGAVYVALFYCIYGAWLVLPLTIRGWLRMPLTALTVCMGVAWCAWQGYVIWIGGDFLEFRMMMASFPFVAILLGGVLYRHKSVWGRWTVAALLLAASVAWGVWQPSALGFESRKEMVAFAESCGAVADGLNSALGEARKTVRIALSPAGVIPFKTAMPALDLLGLCDDEIARSGELIEAHRPRFGNRPGHVRMASWELVRRRQVHLLLNQPWVISLAELDALDWTAETFVRYWMMGKGNDARRVDLHRVRFPSTGESVPPVVAWPMPGERFLMTVYLTPHAGIDAAIQRTGARVIR